VLSTSCSAALRIALDIQRTVIPGHFMRQVCVPAGIVVDSHSDSAGATAESSVKVIRHLLPPCQMIFGGQLALATMDPVDRPYEQRSVSKMDESDKRHAPPASVRPAQKQADRMI